MASPLDSTYGAWLVSVFVETFLFGIGVLQTWIYFAGRPADVASIKFSVLIVLFLETVQVVFFFSSTYSRFVDLFGVLQLELIWEDSLQLLAAYLSAFVVQIFFASRVYKLTRGHGKFSIPAIGMYLIFLMAGASIVAGVAQTIWSYQLRSYLKLGDTKAVTTVQSATSLACDLLITLFLCLFLTSQKGDVKKTNYMMDRLIYEAINRGTLTALASGVTLVLFLALPDTFYFFITLAPSSKLYMNSMLATLNTRQRIREGVASVDKGWNSIPVAMNTLGTSSHGHLPSKIQGESLAGVDFEATSVDLSGKSVDGHHVRVQVQREVYVSAQ